MSSISKIGNCTLQGTQKAASSFGTLVDESYPLGKIMKIVKNVLDIAKRLNYKLSPPLKAVRDQFGEATFWLDTFSFFSVMKTICCKDEDGKYFLTNKNKNSKAKRIGMGFLGGCVSASMVSAGARLGFYSLGKIGKATLCRIPVVGLFIRSSYGIYKVGSAIDCGQKIVKANKGITKSKNKITKWEARPELINKLREGDNTSIENLGKKYNEKIVKLEKGNFKGYSQDKTATKIKLYKDRLAFIETKQITELTSDLERKDLKARVKWWTADKLTNESNKKKNIVGLVESVSKVASTVLSLAAEALAITALPVYLTVMSLGMISDLLSLKKILMDKEKKPKQDDKISDNGPNGGPSGPGSCPAGMKASTDTVSPYNEPPTPSRSPAKSDMAAAA